MLSIGSVFLGSQQIFVLPDSNEVQSFSIEQLEDIKSSLTASKKDDADQHPSWYMLFVWQCPTMLLGYAVVFFLAGFCSVVLSPLAQNPRWNDDAKVGSQLRKPNNRKLTVCRQHWYFFLWQLSQVLASFSLPNSCITLRGQYLNVTTKGKATEKRNI
jgi:hypothetical protein